MGNGMGAGTHQGHAALQHIEQLRELVDGGATDEAANAGDARIFTGGLLDLGIGMHAHGAEFPHLDDLAVPAMALLLEQHGARGGQLHRQGGAEQKRAQEQDGQQGDTAVQCGLGQRGGGIAGERAFVEVDRGQAIDIRNRVIEQLEALQVGDPHHVDVGVEQVDVEPFNLLGGGEGQGDVEAADFVLGNQVAQARQVAHKRIEAVIQVGLVVGGDQAYQRLTAFAHQLVGQFLGEVAGADDERCARGLELVVVAAGERVQWQEQAGLEGETRSGPVDHHLAREKFGGLGQEGHDRQAGEQHQPACQQPAQACYVAMVLVIDAHQRVGRHGPQDGEQGEHAVLGIDMPGLAHGQGAEQQGQYPHRGGPLAPESEATASRRGVFPLADQVDMAGARTGCIAAGLDGLLRSAWRDAALGLGPLSGCLSMCGHD
ncbi:hypothetical protein D9M70_423550 [compost metagenome]